MSFDNEVSDELAAEAIRESRSTLDNFVSAFQNRGPVQSRFMVVVLEADADSARALPVGILVDEISDGVFSGRRVPNALQLQPGRRMTCNASEIADWSYVDTFEMVGGSLYRSLYGRLEGREKFDIRDSQPYVIERTPADASIDSDSIQVFRDIANGRIHRLESLSPLELSIDGISAPMPTLHPDEQVVVSPVTIPGYAAMYGDRRMIDLLWSRGVMADVPGRFSPLAESSYTGNLETTIRLIELGCDVNALDSAPLHNAVVCDNSEIVQYLLESGAKCDPRGVRGETPLFHAPSVEVAKSLIDAGADVNAVDDEGATCLDVHFLSLPECYLV